MPVRVFQTLEREYEETRVPLNGDAAEKAAFARALAAAHSRAKADARETKIRVMRRARTRCARPWWSSGRGRLP